MPITSITIENFKGIGEKAVTIPIRPITLLFGKNSSGKSTVLQAMRYFSEVKNLWPNMGRIEMSGGLNTDLNDFRSLVHRHELDRKIRIRWTMGDNATQTAEWYEVVTGWQEGNPRFHNFESSLNGLVLKTGEEICFSFSSRQETSADAVIGSNGEELIFWKEIKIEDIGKIYVNTTDLSNQAKKLIDYMNDRIHKLLLNPKETKTEKFVDTLGRKKFIIRHLGPFREVPPRDYERPKTPDESRWQKGLGAWDALARDPKLLEKTNHYLKEILQLGYTIKQPEPDQNFQLYDKNNDIDVGLSDVGVGVAQIIPVVVGALDGSLRTFAVEQPELHVHPAVQVALGDLFIDSVRKREQDLAEFRQKLKKEKDLEINKLNKLNKLIENLEKSKKIENTENKEPIEISERRIEDLKKHVLHVNERTEIFETLDLLDLIKKLIEKDSMFIFFLLPKENSMIIENPKFLEFIDATKQRDRTMLIETHSEHLLLRLLRRVRETKRRRRAETTESEQIGYELTPEDLSVIYVRSTPAGVKFTPINVTEDGDFDAPWPEGFFEERDSEWY